MPNAAGNLEAINTTDWIDNLTPLQLPVDQAVKDQALSKINAPSANAKNLAHIIQQDPVLSLRLFHHANRSLDTSGSESHELSHTISLLGFPMTKSLISDSPELDHNTAYAKPYLQQISISVHAAFQAEGWANKQRHWPAGELYWPSLFHCSPLWALWHEKGEKMQQWLYTRAKHSGASSLSIEQTLFGLSLAKLCSRLSKTWHLPHLSQNGWRDEQINQTKSWVNLSRLHDEQVNTPATLQRLCSNPAFAIMLANRFAEQTEWDWYSKRTLRLQQVLATTIGITCNDAISITHQVAIDASHNQSVRGVMSSAAQLLSFYKKSDDFNDEQIASEERTSLALHPTQQVSTTTQPSRSHSSGIGRQTEFEKVVNRLTNQASSFGNLHEVMNLTTDTLCKHAQLERATLSLLNLKLKELKTFYSSGCTNTPALKNYTHHLQRGDLLNKLMQKPASLRVDTSNYEKIWPLLPSSFQEACGTDEFFMMSLFANKRPIALLYADRGISHQALTDDQYKLFKRISQAVCKCLAKLHH